MNIPTIPKFIARERKSDRITPYGPTNASSDLDSLVDSSQHALFTAKAVFPFDLFPDQLSIEANQINFSKKSFFSTYHIQSIPIKNVADVLLQTSIVFASLKIIDSSYIENSIKIDFLNRAEACKARRIIQGLVIAMKNGIDTSKIKVTELAQKVEKIGEAQSIDVA
ncbi:MAG: hypothetical protein KBC15_00405 [Candidatus Levybacteria bacterium]|nr:hypothetical protein [Candidatus Levybacteria bacterium]